MAITKNQAQIYKVLKNNFVQLTLYGMGVFIFIFIASVYNYSLQSWEKMPDITELKAAIDSLEKVLGTPKKNVAATAVAKARFRDAWVRFQSQKEEWEISKETLQKLFPIFWGSLLYFLMVGIPVLFIYCFIYKRRLDFLLRYVLTAAQINGWVFPLFLISSTLIALLFTFLLDGISPEHREQYYLILIAPNYYINFVTIEIICLMSVGAAFTKATIEKNRELERGKRLTDIRRRRAVEDTLALIRARIRPHFLFNALQNLKILARQKSDDLPNLMNQLSLLLRYTFTEADRKTVTIAKEIEFISSYIALEKLNISRDTQFSYSLNIDSEGLNQEIAPMLLLVIVENCFKHYNKSSDEEKIIQIEVETNTQYLTLKTLNSFDIGVKNEHDTAYSNGFGLTWVEENLQLLYPNQYQLDNGFQNGNQFFVHLKIPLQ